MKYTVVIRETLYREITVEADTPKNALEKGTFLYDSEYIVLDADDCVSTRIDVKDCPLP